ncbi:MAG: RNA polymerase factor sigma-54 [Hyphomicrobiaceae bacterium]
MALSAKMEMRQGQQLVMTPQLQQAIRLLQLSNLELNQFIDSELERNPLLEREDPNTAPVERPDVPVEAVERVDSRPEADASEDSWLDLAKPAADPVAALDTDHENICPDTAPGDYAQEAGSSALAGSTFANARQVGSSFSDDDYNLESFVASEISLKDHLTQQLPLALPDQADLMIGQNLIDLVDEAGYMPADLGVIAERLGTDDAHVSRVLATLQTFDPPGVFARSLAECLALQLKEQNRYDPQIALFLANLNLLATHNMAALRKAVGCDMDELDDMIGEIKHLNPKPGLQFGSVQVQPVVPDVYVRAAFDGSWHIELNSDTLPRVLVNRNYFARVSKTSTADRDKTYLLECLQTANWLVKSLDQRARTILRVSEEIVRQQDAFFMYGVQHLRPLNLKTVADAISMHESTVSRVTSNKYMATPRGIFELKYFFTSSIQSAGEGEAHSSEAVRHRIKQMIEAETARGVLSDDKIVEKLKSDGIDIARRTVAKYREALRIPSSVQRRREKKITEHAMRSA